MRQFFTKNTLEAAAWCKPCGKKTQWKISDGRPQYCLVCFGKLEDAHDAPKEPKAKQEGFKF